MKTAIGSRIHAYAERLGVLLIMVILIAGIGSCDGASCGGLAEWYLGASGGEGGQVIVSGGPTFAHGTVVAIEAVAGECYAFVNWTGDVADPYSPITTVTMDQAQNVTANFALLSYDLTVGSTDGGQVTWPGEDTFTYNCGTVVPLVAAAEDGYYFGNWSGDVETVVGINAPTTTITMEGDYSVTANFEQIPPEQFVLTTSSTAGGSVTTPGEEASPYDEGTVVDLVAEAEECYEFINWTGDPVADPNSATTTITMDAAKNVVANFAPIDCDYLDGWVTDGDPYTACDGTQVCIYQNMTYLDYECVGGECVPTETDWRTDLTSCESCDDGDPCTIDTCVNGECIHTPIDCDYLDGWVEDGSPYTECDGDQVCTYQDWVYLDYDCVDGECVPTETGWDKELIGCQSCDDGDPCTIDTCVNGECVHTPIIEQYDLIISSTAGGNVTTPGEGTFTYGCGTVGLVATPDAYYGFVEWTGDVDTIADICDGSTTITMNGDYSITAKFGLFAGGNGTAGNPYEITDWYHLDNVRNYLSSHFILVNDLDSNSAGYTELASPTAGEGKGWHPIAVANNTFVGSFDGQGYEICDLFINRPDESEVGPFGATGEGGVIENVGVNGNVTGYDNTGGLVGKNEGAISNSFSACRVIGNYNVGGLVGKNDNPEGAVTNSYATGNVTGTNNVGGLVGWNLEGTMSESYAAGRVTGANNVGGLTGKNDDTASNSYATGGVTGNDNVGGLLGRNTNNGNVANSYSTGSVTGSLHTGGLVGRNDGTVSNSFWDTWTSGQGASAGGTGKTTAQMMNIATFSSAGWDIVAVDEADDRNTGYIWNIVDGVTYPFLSWQPV